MANKYDVDFKLNTVKLVLEEGKVASQVARDMQISEKTLYGWIARYKDDPKLVLSQSIYEDQETPS